MRAKTVRVVEHGLPDALQTHEILYDAPSAQLLITQMEEGRLLRIGVIDVRTALERRVWRDRPAT